MDQDNCPIVDVINVHRGNVLNSSLYAFQRINLNAGAKMDVAFVYVESKGSLQGVLQAPHGGHQRLGHLRWSGRSETAVP